MTAVIATGSITFRAKFRWLNVSFLKPDVENVEWKNSV
jgi:hypothetical protein